MFVIVAWRGVFVIGSSLALGDGNCCYALGDDNCLLLGVGGVGCC